MICFNTSRRDRFASDNLTLKGKELKESIYKDFEHWFAKYWEKAKGGTRLKNLFFIHDTIWVTNFADSKEFKEILCPTCFNERQKGERTTSGFLLCRLTLRSINFSFSSSMVRLTFRY